MEPVITIRLEVDFSPAVAKLLKAIKPQVEAPETKNEPKKEEAQVENKPEAKAEPKAPEDEPKVETLTVLGEAKPVTVVDVRSAMESKLNEIAGEGDARDNDIAKQVRRVFKDIATRLGDCKPSELPSDKRGDFISEIATLSMTPDGIAPF